jgi:hypothetical protein
MTIITLKLNNYLVELWLCSFKGSASKDWLGAWQRNPQSTNGTNVFCFLSS